MVETALVLPLFLSVVLGMIESARLVYVRSVMESDARAAARAMAVDLVRRSDCPAWQAGTDSGGGWVELGVDPSSVWNNGFQPPANAPPGPNRGYLYLYPAAATAVPGSCPLPNSCVPACSLPVNDVETVTATVTYDFVPRVPFPVGSITVTVSATEQVQQGAGVGVEG